MHVHAKNTELLTLLQGWKTCWLWSLPAGGDRYSILQKHRQQTPSHWKIIFVCTLSSIVLMYNSSYMTLWIDEIESTNGGASVGSYNKYQNAHTLSISVTLFLTLSHTSTLTCARTSSDQIHSSGLCYQTVHKHWCLDGHHTCAHMDANKEECPFSALLFDHLWCWMK